MGVYELLSRQQQAFGSTRFFDFEIAESFVFRFGIVRSSLTWFSTALMPSFSGPVSLVFVNDAETDARLCEVACENVQAAIEENKYYGYVFLMNASDTLVAYYETVEGIGFAGATEMWKATMSAQRREISEASGYLDAELSAVENFNENAKRYVSKMRTILSS